MQWSHEPQGGFTWSERPDNPPISGGPYGFEHLNAAAQRHDPESLLDWIERIIRMRKEVPEIGWGDFSVIEAGTPGVLGLRYDWRNNAVLCLHNLKPEPQEVSFATGLDGDGRNLIDLLTGSRSLAGEDDRHTVLLEGHGYRWYRVGGLDYLLKRSPI